VVLVLPELFTELSGDTVVLVFVSVVVVGLFEPLLSVFVDVVVVVVAVSVSVVFVVGLLEFATDESTRLSDVVVVVVLVLVSRTASFTVPVNDVSTVP